MSLRGRRRYWRGYYQGMGAEFREFQRELAYEDRVTGRQRDDFWDTRIGRDWIDLVWDYWTPAYPWKFKNFSEWYHGRRGLRVRMLGCGCWTCTEAAPWAFLMPWEWALYLVRFTTRNPAPDLTVRGVSDLLRRSSEL